VGGQVGKIEEGGLGVEGGRHTRGYVGFSGGLGNLRAGLRSFNSSTGGVWETPVLPGFTVLALGRGGGGPASAGGSGE